MYGYDERNEPKQARFVGKTVSVYLPTNGVYPNESFSAYTPSE